LDWIEDLQREYKCMKKDVDYRAERGLVDHYDWKEFQKDWPEQFIERWKGLDDLVKSRFERYWRYTDKLARDRNRARMEEIWALRKEERERQGLAGLVDVMI
jgi:hypothetical protein